MTTKGKLKLFFDTENEDLKLIEKYEENIIFFNDLLKNGHKEDIEFVIPIKMYKYANPLEKKGYYNKAFKVLDEIEKDLEKLRGQSKWHGMYSERVLFLKGVCLGRLKKYRESNKYFKLLVVKKPINDNFVDWYKSNKKNQIEEISSYIIVVAMIICIICVITNIITFRIPLIVEVLTFSIGAGTWIVSYIWKKIIDKQKITD
jgi:hypothetical protein